MGSKISQLFVFIQNIGQVIYDKINNFYTTSTEDIETTHIAMMVSIFSLLLAYYSLRWSNKQAKKQGDLRRAFDSFQENQAILHQSYNQIQEKYDALQTAALEYYKNQSDELYKLQSETNLAIEYTLSDKTENTGLFTVHNRGMSKAKNITFSYKLNGLVGFNYKGVTNNGEVIKDKEAKIYILDPSESSIVVVTFHHDPQPVEIDYAWDNVNGIREHRSRTLSPLNI